LPGDDAVLGEIMCECVGQIDKLAVSQVAVPASHRDATGITVGMFADEAVDGVVAPETRPIIFLVAIDMEQCQQRI
jgi:hypothetical protein